MATRKPSPAQLRFLLHLVTQGGAGYFLPPFRLSTVRSCRANLWTTRQPTQAHSVAKYEITTAGRDAARNAAPDEYASALPADQVEAELLRATRNLTEDVKRQLDRLVPPAAAADTGIVREALRGNRICVFTSPCLGEFSPMRAHGVAIRISKGDLTNSAPPPTSVRLGGPLNHEPTEATK